MIITDSNAKITVKRAGGILPSHVNEYSKKEINFIEIHTKDAKYICESYKYDGMYQLRSHDGTCITISPKLVTYIRPMTQLSFKAC